MSYKLIFQKSKNGSTHLVDIQFLEAEDKLTNNMFFRKTEEQEKIKNGKNKK